MPYTTQDLRDIVDNDINMVIDSILFEGVPKDKYNGVLNYCISEILVRTILAKYDNKWSYGAINDMIGVLECCKLELYRRGAGPYEDKCIEKNGDISAYKE